MIKHLFLIFISLIFINIEPDCQSTTRLRDKPLDTIFQGLTFRNIGPFRGGRSVASCGVIGDPMTYYMGATGGGIWKTTDAGITWINISDGHLNTGSVGAIAVAPSDPNVIYVGMGEHPVRGVMTSHGDGVYKSTDAGKTWEHMGLPMSRHIAEIKIHPNDPELVYLAVQGALHGDSHERGVYKSTDGGAHWDKILYVDQTTGATDLTMDPSNPRILLASMWDHRRTPWQVRSGGPGSAIYKSADAGKTWTKVGGGLPTAMGKSAIDISPANTQIIYVNVEAEGTKGGVYRSDDGGDHWTQTSKDRVTVARAWYYIEIFADPIDENTVYVLNAPVLKSIDGGRHFKNVRNPHGDQHHLWINPHDANNMILSNDGGACISFNGGKSWSTQQNQPTIQFYRVITDHLFPYNIYGGQQDNSSIVTASRTIGAGIGWKDWFNGPGCESAFLAFDPDDPQEIYGSCIQGGITVMDRTTKIQQDIMAYPIIGLGWRTSDMKYRYNWNAPIVASPQDPNVIYHCGNHVLVTRDKGQSWAELSPDLTKDDKSKQGAGGVPYTNEGAGGEVYNTISYMAASPHTDQVLWTGSDCGLVHVTRDGGGHWSDVTPHGIGEALINSIEVSPHDPATAYIAVTKYKFNDFTPLIYYTKDYGKTWTKITRGIAEEDFVRVVREDKKRAGLLYAGTETGLYISYDDGSHWQDFQLNLPICPVNDLTFQDNDLIVATAGRSFWILDDLTAIQSGIESMSDNIDIYHPKDSYRIRGGGRSRPGTVLGLNPPSGITFDYYLPEFDERDTMSVVIDILDGNAVIVRSYSSEKDQNFKRFVGGPSAPKLLSTNAGVNRFTWDMHRQPISGINGIFLLGGYSGALVPPGDYTLRMTVGDQVSEASATLLADPRIQGTPKDYKLQYESMLQAESIAKSSHIDVQKMRDIKSGVEAIKKMIGDQSEGVQIVTLADSILIKIESWESQLVQTDQKTFQDVINFPNKLNAEASDLLSKMGSMNPILTEGMKTRLKDLQLQYDEINMQKNHIIKVDLQEFNAAIKKADIDLVRIGG